MTITPKKISRSHWLLVECPSHFLLRLLNGFVFASTGCPRFAWYGTANLKTVNAFERAAMLCGAVFILVKILSL